MRKSTVMIVLLIVSVCLLGAAPTLAAKYNEAPMLQELVKAGKIPPLEQRLPKEPFVVGPGVLMPRDDLNFEIGRYGGTERLIHTTPGWEASVFIQSNEPLLMSPGLTAEGIRGNVLRDWSVTSDQKVFTFYMREGLKWSDGMPVTTDDVLFAYEDVLLNKEITPVWARWLKSGNRDGGTPLRLEVVDKYTFRIIFTEAYGGFPTQLTINGWRGYTDFIKPKHYLRQFHTRYTPLERLEPLIAEAKLNKGEWWTLFNLKDHINWEITRPTAIGFPFLSPWIPTRATPTTLTFERNPYYFKVDTAGNQLPYIDTLRSELVADAETANLKIIAGEMDHSYEYGTLINLPLYRENAEKAGYKIVLYDMHRTTADPVLNLTYNDPVWRQVTRDIRFRKALNMAINREEILDTVYYGFAALPGSVPSTYNPQEANRLLDEMGLSRRDSDGFRLGPDGRRFVIPIEFQAPFLEIKATAELIADYWSKVGVQTTTKVLEGGLWSTRRAANELKATFFLWTHDRRIWWALWGAENALHWGPLWQKWFDTNGREGEEPPEDVKRYMDAVSKLYRVPPDERPKVHAEFVRLLYDNIYWFITVEDLKYPVIVSNRMGNVSHKGYGIGAQFAGEAYFIKQ
jgi:peptide/nickel transport system substrate-binding protein